MSIVSQLEAIFAVSNVPAKTLYWQGYDMYLDCSLTSNWLSAEEYAAMLPKERRGDEAAGRHAADTETYVYLSNRNAFGDLTEY